MPEDHLLVSTLGRAEADQMADRYGGETIQIPRCLHALRAVRNCSIRKERYAGASPALLALRYRLTERQVYSILAAADEPVDDRQQSLL
jgi:Mor family transcriptional regulator